MSCFEKLLYEKIKAECPLFFLRIIIGTFLYFMKVFIVNLLVFCFVLGFFFLSHTCAFAQSLFGTYCLPQLPSNNLEFAQCILKEAANVPWTSESMLVIIRFNISCHNMPHLAMNALFSFLSRPLLTKSILFSSHFPSSFLIFLPVISEREREREELYS